MSTPLQTAAAHAPDTELRRLRALYQLLKSLTGAHTAQDVYDAAITSLLAATSADKAAILTFDDDGVVRFKAWSGLSADYRQAAEGHIPWFRGARDARAIIVPDVDDDPSLAAFQTAFRTANIRALTFIPLALNVGVFGKMMLYYERPYECSEDELAISQAIASHVAIATERTRAAAALTQSEQRLRAILDNSAAIIFVKDMEGRYTMVNRRHEEVFGTGDASALGRTDFEIFPAEIARRLSENDRAVLAAEAPVSVEETVPHEDGNHTYISIKFPLTDERGAPNAICGIATDITERKQLELASQRLAAIVESSTDAIVAKDLNGTITSWNKGAELLFGYAAHEVIGRSITILAAPDHPEDIPNMLERIQQGTRVEHYETFRRRKDGVIIQVSLNISPVRDSSGRIVGASKVARDITARKQADEERAQLLAREQDARRTAELLNRVAPRLLTELDLQKLVQAVTDTATALVGAEFGAFFHHSGLPRAGAGSADAEDAESFSLFTLAGFTREEFSHLRLPPELFRVRGVLRCHVTDHFDAAAARPVRSYLAVAVVSRSGELLGGLIFGHSRAQSFTESHEAIVVGIAAQAAIAMDNAALFEQARWVQTELKRSNEELRRANQDLETFAYSASHDLQEPLRTIAISAQLLERSCVGSLNSEQDGYLSRILGSTRRMNALIQDLLAYAKATKYAEGSAPVVDSNAVLAGVLESCKVLFAEAGAKVTSGALPLACIHETRLSQLLQNLVGNAVKYRGSQPPEIHISGSEVDGWTIFSVSDNGIGIDKQYADQIFGLFKRLHGRDEYPGSGIGLAICQRVVEQYGGRIWLDRSSPGEGSTFSFSLPASNR